MYCEQCGKQIAGGHSFCMQCGKPVAKTTTSGVPSVVAWYAASGVVGKLRTGLLLAVIVSTSVSALIGIVLVAGGTTDETAIKFAYITFSLAIYALASLAFMALLERGVFEAFAWVGLVLLGLAWVVTSITTLSSGTSEVAARIVLVIWILAWSCVQSALLLLTDQKSNIVRTMTIAAIVSIGLLAVLAVYPAVVQFREVSVAYVKLVGVVVLLDLGLSITCPTVNLLLKKRQPF